MVMGLLREQAAFNCSRGRARSPSHLAYACRRADLRCHCLNFHGRVKEASVKNFQLVRRHTHVHTTVPDMSSAAMRQMSCI